MIVLPAMQPEQTASWLGVLDLYDHLTRTSAPVYRPQPVDQGGVTDLRRYRGLP